MENYSSNTKSFPLSGKKIYLKTLEKDNLESIYIWKNDFDLGSLVMAHPLPVNKREVDEWLLNNQSDKNQVLFGIFLLDSHQCVGIVRLMFIDWISSTAELGIYIGGQENRGYGIGKETIQIILNYAFTSLNMHRISLRVLESNIQAIMCYQSNGFVKEGLIRQQYWCQGKYENVILMGLLKSEFQNRD